MTTICDTLGMVASTGSDNSSLFFLFSESSESRACSSDFEASDGLKIFSLEVDFRIVFFGEVLRFGKGSMPDDSFAFSIGLVNSVGRDEFGFVFAVDLDDSVLFCDHKKSFFVKLTKERFLFIILPIN